MVVVAASTLAGIAAILISFLGNSVYQHLSTTESRLNDQSTSLTRLEAKFSSHLESDAVLNRLFGEQILELKTACQARDIRVNELEKCCARMKNGSK